jgi:pimeloyl-ACP methyl ester carboxylesterase
MSRRSWTPPFRGRGGDILPDSIAEIDWLRLGGVDQWVLIRGENVANPPLILLYGGPGLSETCFFRRFNAPLEKAFTVVYWDQRGSGKSRDPTLSASSLTVEQFLADLDELVDTVTGRLGVKKVVLFGHSWGSALGVLYAARIPDKVAAYVGSGQIGDWPAAEAASYAFALARAERLGHRRALKALTTVGPPPYSADAVWTERTWAVRLDGQLSAETLWEFAWAHLSTPELSVLDLFRLMPTFRSTFAVMWPEVSRVNLLEAAPKLDVPVFFFLGRRDRWVPPETSVAYLDALCAPSKRLVWFEESGHEPFADEPGKFNTSMVELVRPVVVSGGSGKPGTPPKAPTSSGG